MSFSKSSIPALNFTSHRITKFIDDARNLLFSDMSSKRNFLHPLNSTMATTFLNSPNFPRRC